MCDQYMRDLLRVAIVQICQTIGYNATQMAPLELLQDILHKFMVEFSRDLRRQVEHYNRTDANLNDACLTLRSLSINANELIDYINNVEPVPFIYEVPKFPAPKHCNLNFLKPGSKEVLTRPVHIFEHLPPMLAPDPNTTNTCITTSTTASNDKQYLSNETSQDKSIAATAHSKDAANDDTDGLKQAQRNEVLISETMSGQPSEKSDLQAYLKPSAIAMTHCFDEEGGPTREISSVVMTTGGFISPAIEGKLPDTIIPDIIEKLEGLDAPPPVKPPPPPPPAAPAAPLTSSSSTLNDKQANNASTNKIADKAIKLEPNEALMPKIKLENTSRKSLKVPSNNNNNEKEHSKSSSSSGAGSSSKKLGNMHALQNPTMASRLLKKAKKNPANAAFPYQGKLMRMEQTVHNMGGPHAHPYDPNDKTHRKRMKMLQKLSKSTQLLGGDVIDKFRGHINPLVVAGMPPGPERAQLEKLLKKQAKQKQKFLKQQMELGLQQQQSGTTDNALAAAEDKLSASKEAQSVTNDAPSLSTKATGGPEATVQPTALQNPTPMGGELHSPLAVGEKEGKKRNAENSDTPEKSLGKNMSLQIKLSSEPDRSKLNILKKISKQKGLKAASPNGGRGAVLPNAVFGGDDSPVINLPSGTTITPAPPTGERHLFAPDELPPPPTTTTKTFLSKAGSLEVRATSTPTGVLPKDSIFDNGASFVDKPKKRGRKPGSKNHPKVPGGLNATAPPAKLTKKLKLEAKKLKLTGEACGTQFIPMGNANAAEPLNLTHPSSGETPLGQFPAKFPKGFMLNDDVLAQQMKPRKEKKKNKDKNLLLAGSNADPHSGKMSLNAPTKEEVNSINKKLSRIDTVLKPAPAGLASDFPKSLTDLEIHHSPTKAATTAKGSPGSSGGKKRSAANMLSPNLGAFMPTPRFPIPMIPLYPFVPRPGLIPAPGLFANPMLGNFAGNTKKGGLSNMLLQNCMPFPNFKAPTGGKLGLQEAEQKDSFADLTLHAGDRNYCNVAPLVPESVKLMPPGLALPEKQQQQPYAERECLKPSKIQFSPNMSESATDSWVKKAADSLDGRLTGAKMTTSAPGSGCVPLDRRLEGASSSTLESLQSKYKSSDGFNLFGATTSTSATAVLTTLNANEPIEVSDDSIDAPPTPTPTLAPTPLTTTTTKVISPHAATGGGLSLTKQSSNLFMKSSLMAMDGGYASTMSELDLSYKETQKKSKKSHKFTLKGSAIKSSGVISGGALDVFAAGDKNGVGKLAGGADLIPLSGTGFSYSAKTIPSTSLTASGQTSFPVGKKDTTTGTGTGTGVFSELTITSNPLSRKEHKKLKKLKEGKLKKKKDKKDKSKSKERADKHIATTTTAPYNSSGSSKPDLTLALAGEKLTKDKDHLKKLKKEKKKEKEKQRLTMECSADASTGTGTATAALTVNQACYPAGMFDKQKANILTASTTTTPAAIPTAGTIATTPTTTAITTGSALSTASLVPKLTLKLGNCPSPVPPEDAPQKGALMNTTTTPTPLTPHLPPPPLSSSSTNNNNHHHQHQQPHHHHPALKTTANERATKEPSPELARISPLVTRPPKQKLNTSDAAQSHAVNAGSASLSIGNTSSSEPPSTPNSSKTTVNPSASSIATGAFIPPPSPWLAGGTLAASCVLLPQQLLQSVKPPEHQLPAASISTTTTGATTANAAVVGSSMEHATSAASLARQSPVPPVPETSRPSSYVDAEGNRVWICPACGKVDDGSAMIGCDGCDAWYHWICVGIVVAPKDNEDWFCRVCITKKKGSHGSDKKKKRNKKK